MRTFLFSIVILIVTLLVQGCASAGLRDKPDQAALQAVAQAVADGDAEQAVTLADAAVADCAPGKGGFSCSLATRMILANQFAQLGLIELAVSHARSASDAADTYGDAFSQYPARALLATMAAQGEQVAEAEAALHGARSALSEMEQQTPSGERESLDAARGMLNGPQARIFLLKGEPARAATSQSMLIETMQRVKPGHPNLPVELLNLADMYNAAGDTESTLDALRRAASLSAEQGNVDLENEALAAIQALSSPE